MENRTTILVLEEQWEVRTIAVVGGKASHQRSRNSSHCTSLLPSHPKWHTSAVSPKLWPSMPCMY